MWSTTMNENCIVNLSVMGAVKLETEDEVYRIYAATPQGFRWLLLESDDKECTRRTFERLKKELMQAFPVRVCYHEREE